MNDLLDLPAERDLPPERAARMRADLLESIRHPRHRTRAGLVAAVAAAVVLVLVGVSVALGGGQRGIPTRPATPTPDPQAAVRLAARQCLLWNAQSPRYRLSESDLAVAAEQDGFVATLFFTSRGDAYWACMIDTTRSAPQPKAPDGRAYSGGAGGGGPDWPHWGWLLGPVDVLSPLSGTAPTHRTSPTPPPRPFWGTGGVALVGRVSARVHRLVLDHGNGQITEAHLAHGGFAMVAKKPVAANATLLAYDATGAEIYRHLVDELGPVRGCWVDPSGKVISGKPGPDCRPAERWTR